MCDTQVLIANGAVWFAKNSDREPSEPQVVTRVPAVRGDRTPVLKATYLEIPQVPDRHAVILSKPSWMWGAEMGANDQGVVIGNEAIFSRSAQRAPALLGMDFVRLGLERGASAEEALSVITELLERHGQGGPAGFRNKSFCYDNSFLIADARGAWVLETSGREWVAKRVEHGYAISNQLTIGEDYERSSAPLQARRRHFARNFDTRLWPFLARARDRRALFGERPSTDGGIDFHRLASLLRRHHAGNEDPSKGSNRDVCMHAGGLLRPHQTTGSMIARLTGQGATLMLTGTSAPCLSIFRPAAFEGRFHVLTPVSQQVEAPLWRRHEWLHRWALTDRHLRTRMRITRDHVEAQIFGLLEDPAPDAELLMRADRLAAAWHKVLWESLDQSHPPRLRGYWLRLGRQDGIDITRAKA